MPTIVNGTGDERDEAARAAPRTVERRAQPRRMRAGPGETLETAEPGPEMQTVESAAGA